MLIDIDYKAALRTMGFVQDSRNQEPRKKGRPKKRPPVRRITLELPCSLLEALDAEAAELGQDRTTLIIRKLKSSSDD